MNQTIRQSDPALLGASLALSGRLLGAVESAVAALAMEVPDIQLPDIEPAGDPNLSQAHLRAVAPLYFASELERAGLLPCVELLAALYGRGGLPGDVGAAGAALERLWKSRRDRLTAEERAALFSRLFDAPAPPLASPNPDQGPSGGAVFDDLLIGVCEALIASEDAAYWPSSPGAASRARLQMSVQSLASEIGRRIPAIAHFAAREVIDAITQALGVMREPAVQRRYGANSTWGAVDAMSRRLLGRAVPVRDHVARAQAGQILLAWCAEEMHALASMHALPAARLSPAVSAATAWMHASVSVLERSAETSFAGSRA